MTSRKYLDDVLLQLGLAGGNAFYGDEAWREKIKGTIACPHCESVYEKVRSIDAIVRNKPRRTDIDLVGGCYRVLAFSTRFIELIGPRRMAKVAGLGRIFDVGGFEHERHRTAVALRNPVVLRGGPPTTSAYGPSAGVCRKCGRVMYAVDRNKRYVLRSQLPDEPFFLSGGAVFCTPKFYEKIIQPAKLIRVDVFRIPIRDEPLDGMPESTEELKEYLKSHRKLK